MLLNFQKPINCNCGLQLRAIGSLQHNARVRLQYDRIAEDVLGVPRAVRSCTSSKKNRNFKKLKWPRDGFKDYTAEAQNKNLYRKSNKMFLVTVLRQLNQLACQECISFKAEQILPGLRTVTRKSLPLLR